MSLPEFLSPPPEKEAIELALDALVFGPLEADAEARETAKDTETPPLRAYVLLDASISPEIALCAQAFDEPARCLFDGAAFEELSDVGPWLIELRRYGDAWDWFVEDGWGNNWGIVIQTRLPLAKLKTHLKKFIKVEDESGETYFFKFYRPEHLNTYLPAFERDQIDRFMAGLENILAETFETPETLIHYEVSEKEGALMGTVDLVELGLPMRTQPPTAAEAEEILANLSES